MNKNKFYFLFIFFYFNDIEYSGIIKSTKIEIVCIRFIPLSIYYELNSERCISQEKTWVLTIIFYSINDIAGYTNAHKVFVKTCRVDDVTSLEFMHHTIVLTLQTSPKFNKKNVTPNHTLQRLTGRQFNGANKSEKEDTKNPRPIINCRVCYVHGIRIDKGKPLKTVHIFWTCPSQSGLHINNCFEIYHTVMNCAE